MGRGVNNMGMIAIFTGVITGAVAVIIGADNIIPVHASPGAAIPPDVCACQPPVVSSCAGNSLVSPLTSILTTGRLARCSVTLSLPPVCPTFEPSALPTRIVLFSPV